MGGFLEPPVLSELGAALWSGTHVTATVTGAVDSVPARLVVGRRARRLDQILAPGNVTTFDSPTSARSPAASASCPGTLDTTVWAARIDGFTYGIAPHRADGGRRVERVCVLTTLGRLLAAPLAPAS